MGSAAVSCRCAVPVFVSPAVPPMIELITALLAVLIVGVAPPSVSVPPLSVQPLNVWNVMLWTVIGAVSPIVPTVLVVPAARGRDYRELKSAALPVQNGSADDASKPRLRVASHGS